MCFFKTQQKLLRLLLDYENLTLKKPSTCNLWSIKFLDKTKCIRKSVSGKKNENKLNIIFNPTDLLFA